MQHFQLILIVIGVLAIVAVLVHGFIVSRKEKALRNDNLADSGNLVSTKANADSQDDVIGNVRISRAESEDEDENYDFVEPAERDELEDIDFAADFPKSDADELAQSITLDNELSDFEEMDKVSERSDSKTKFAAESDNQQAAQQVAPEHQDHFVFNVAAKEGQAVRGHELLQFFLTAGFRFGDMSIFHRHLHSDGTGPVLFSIANMMKPGVFDPENMEQFSSEGVTFFLTAPNNEINIKEAFDMMVVAVEQMAEEFDCVVLNGERQPLTEAQYREYHKRLSRYI